MISSQCSASFALNINSDTISCPFHWHCENSLDNTHVIAKTNRIGNLLISSSSHYIVVVRVQPDKSGRPGVVRVVIQQQLSTKPVSDENMPSNRMNSK